MNGQQAKLGATMFGVAGLAGCGFTLSFAALRELAVGSGIRPDLAFLWPLAVDGFIVVATVIAFRLKERGLRVTWYPWSALILFAAVSVAGNALHAAESTDRSVPVWIATVVSAVPAVALLLASHLLVVIAEHGSTQRAVVEAEPVADAGELTAHALQRTTRSIAQWHERFHQARERIRGWNGQCTRGEHVATRTRP